MMRQRSICVCLAILLLSYKSTALPFLPKNNIILRPRASYSVVAVDGGSGSSPTSSAANGESQVATVTQTFDQTQTVTASPSSPPTTMLSSVVETEQGPTKTVDNFVTFSATATISVSPGPVIQIVDVDQGNNEPSPTLTTASVDYSTSTVGCSTTPIALPQTPPSLLPSPIQSPISKSPLSENISPPPVKHDTPPPQPVQHETSDSQQNWAAPQPAPQRGDTNAQVQPNGQGSQQYQQQTTSYTATSTTIPARTTTSFDNGMWHTSYPAWNATLATRAP